ncbi:MAG TPA: hypothetical protein VGC01_06180 [Mucilaginibacter sp.]
MKIKPNPYLSTMILLILLIFLQITAGAQRGGISQRTPNVKVHHLGRGEENIDQHQKSWESRIPAEIILKEYCPVDRR